MNENLLIHGENTHALQHLIEVEGMSGTIDLVYIDPPFATGGQFTISEGRSATISNSRNGLTAYADKVTGKNYIRFLEKRILLLWKLLSEKGSIYVHIDYKIGHYVKIMMDEVFGIDNFRNDITRVKCNPKNFERIGYGNIKDMILFYTKTSSPIWNEPKASYTEQDVEKLFKMREQDGRRYTTVPIHAPGETENGQSNRPFRGMLPPEGRHWRTDVDTLERWDNEGLIYWSINGNPRKKIYLDTTDGKRVQDIWEFKDPQYPMYPTEKNANMLDLIIRTSSNIGSIVLDCFCGSGTTLKSAQQNGRHWIGIDESSHAINRSKRKIDSISGDLFIPQPSYRLIELAEWENSKSFA